MKDENKIIEIVSELRKRVFSFSKIKNNFEAKKYLINLYDWFKEFKFTDKIIEKFFTQILPNNRIIQDDIYHPLNFLNDEAFVNYFINNCDDIQFYKEILEFFGNTKEIKNLKKLKKLYYLPLFDEIKDFFKFYFYRWADFLIDLYILKKAYTNVFIDKPKLKEIKNLKLTFKNNILTINDIYKIPIYNKKNLDPHNDKKLGILLKQISLNNNYVEFSSLKKLGFTSNDFYRYISYLNYRIFLNPNKSKYLINKGIILLAKKDEKLSTKGNPVLKIIGSRKY